MTWLVYGHGKHGTLFAAGSDQSLELVSTVERKGVTWAAARAVLLFQALTAEIGMGGEYDRAEALACKAVDRGG